MPSRFLPSRSPAELLIGVGDHADEIDATIRAYAKGWTLERMPALDRALLRIGVYELTYTPEVPDRRGDLRGRRAGQDLQHRRQRQVRQRHAQRHRRRPPAQLTVGWPRPRRN